MFGYMRQGKGFYREIFHLALPIVLQNMIMISLAMADTFMVGLLGEKPMAAVTVANTPVLVIDLLIFGFQSGSTVLFSQYWGKQDMGAINRVIGLGLYCVGAITTLFALVMYFAPVASMSIFCNDPELVQIAASYIPMIGLSFIFTGLTSIYIAAHRGMENPKLGLIIFSTSTCINTFLNWVFIFGNLGAPAMGVEGAALATFIARVCEFLIMACYAKWNKRFKLIARYVLVPGREMARRFVKYATPVVLNETLWGLGTAMYPTIMGHMANSSAILAAYTIAGNTERLCTVAVFGVASTASVVIGREIGRGKGESVYRVGAALDTVAVGVGLASSCLLFAVLKLVMEPYAYPLFGLSEMSAGIATMMMTVTAIFLTPRTFNSTNIVGVLRGGGDVRAATLIDVLPLWCVAIPMAALCGLVFRLDIFWVYIAVSVENVFKFFLGIWRFRSKKWINDITGAAVK